MVKRVWNQSRPPYFVLELLVFISKMRLELYIVSVIISNMFVCANYSTTNDNFRGYNSTEKSISFQKENMFENTNGRY